MRALKRFVMAPQEELIRVTTQAHEGIETYLRGNPSPLPLCNNSSP